MERFELKTAVVFGAGALEALDGLAGRRVLVVTDRFLAQSGLLDQVLARLESCTVETFTQVVPDPPLEVVAKGVRQVEEFRPDVLVAFGGGSALDCAKAMAHFSPQSPPLWAIPTTAGTGSEVTSFAVLTDSEKGVKYPLVDDSLLPALAVLEPSFLERVPPAVTADTGMDVLTHAAEAWVARGGNPYTDALAEKAFTLAFENLSAAFDGDREAKANMLLASNLAGLAFNGAGLGLCHGLAHALGGRYHIPHGRLNALLLSHVIRFNAAEEKTAKKYGRLAKACGLAPTWRTLAAGLDRLRSQLKLPVKLTACGVEGKIFKTDADAIAASALADRCTPANPRAVTADDVKAILKELA